MCPVPKATASKPARGTTWSFVGTFANEPAPHGSTARSGANVDNCGCSPKGPTISDFALSDTPAPGIQIASVSARVEQLAAGAAPGDVPE